MKNSNNKHIALALFTMGILTAGTEILTEYISKGAINITSIRFWFAITIVLIYYVFALQLSKTIKK
ncbi:hypothetical protein [Rasiella sp. SM2506]|uniref:hypothetical protein n=1 Tax=Rasiella sp. SM2506 TaxID=3423914 RepID=UPI003D7A8124